MTETGANGSYPHQKHISKNQDLLLLVNNLLFCSTIVIFLLSFHQICFRAKRAASHSTLQPDRKPQFFRRCSKHLGLPFSSAPRSRSSTTRWPSSTRSSWSWWSGTWSRSPSTGQQNPARTRKKNGRDTFTHVSFLSSPCFRSFAKSRIAPHAVSTIGTL